MLRWRENIFNKQEIVFTQPLGNFKQSCSLLVKFEGFLIELTVEKITVSVASAEKVNVSSASLRG